MEIRMVLVCSSCATLHTPQGAHTMFFFGCHWSGGTVSGPPRCEAQGGDLNPKECGHKTGSERMSHGNQLLFLGEFGAFRGVQASFG